MRRYLNGKRKRKKKQKICGKVIKYIDLLYFVCLDIFKQFYIFFKLFRILSRFSAFRVLGRADIYQLSNQNF